MVMQQVEETGADAPVYNPRLSTEELERRAFQVNAVDSATTMAERAAEIEKSYRAIDSDYTGILGTAMMFLDNIGVTSFETRLKSRINRSKGTKRALEGIVEDGLRQSMETARMISGTETRQSYAYALMSRYETMMGEIRGKIAEKQRQYEELVAMSIGNPEELGYEQVAEELSELNLDLTRIKGRYDEAAVVVVQSEYQASQLKSKKAIVDAAINKSRTSALKAGIAIKTAEVHTDNRISPYRVASSIQAQEMQSAEMGKINEELGSLVERTLAAYQGLDISSIDTSREDERTQRILQSVSEERDTLGLRAKRIMEAKRAS